MTLQDGTMERCNHSKTALSEEAKEEEVGMGECEKTREQRQEWAKGMNE